MNKINLIKQLRKFSSFNSKSVPLPHTQLHINGKFVPSVSGQTFETLNPASEEAITKVAKANSEDVNKAVLAARNAFDNGPWSKISGFERARLMNKLADLMEKNIESLSALEALDTGKAYSTVLNVELPLAIEHMRYFAGFADKINGT
jgi:aldehyde dehydrogenase (NAD+)